MITRYSYKWSAPKLIECPIKDDFELITLIEPISFNEDKTVKEYNEKVSYKKTSSKWQDFINSFDLGSVSDQVISHLTRGTPLVTAHTLPPGDYTPASVLKGAEIVREMQAKGITLEMLAEAYQSEQSIKVEEVSSSESETE